ncbi:ATP-dependent DNA helicase RecG [Taylorella asinigenitalis]|uniref:ATP-dependent DNA helicase RecG n=1 Tax=Taylorella asinigenitalis (strain MCE3) TaxID=1008459 RepID=G4Q9T6_TAYAM|nr:ATP-dependent DNA helicase RecG [Taylorella asinigenitalis]AEP36855.1 ATP-dependent DNA helicase RecG [Taylorella asinigenitalis MCE3]
MVRPSKSLIDEKIKSLGLLRPIDFALHIPLRYEDETKIYKVSQAQTDAMMQFEGQIHNVEVTYAPRKSLNAVLDDGTGLLKLRWLNFYPNQVKFLETSPKVRVRGPVKGNDRWGFTITHPKIGKVTDPLPQTLTPIYPSSAGLTQDVLRRKIRDVILHMDSVDGLKDTLPQEILTKYSLPSFKETIFTLHNPKIQDALALENKTHPAWLRLVFDELLAQQLTLQIAREKREQLKAIALVLDDTSLYEGVLREFSLKLTSAQIRVLEEIKEDLKKSKPMNRLLQGDVGSGKTIVAALAASLVISNGYQVAIMAPTEILAEQHYIKLSKWFEPLGISVTKLYGSLKAKEKKEVYESITNSSAKLVVGTQALIQDTVDFANLGLLIVDEQHRFGVMQRLTLNKKGESGELVPHQLSMSATPIPRTLAMSYLADIDVSTIDELPPGRTPIVTKLVKIERREEILSFLISQCKKGHQAYWVCPLVEESEALQLQTAVDTYDWIKGLLPDLKAGLVHGKLKPQEKNEIMEKFKKNELQILVATTVIEVGVDVPNASIMVIEHAERFGLAQLHQLRGRVGRGCNSSICILMYQEPLTAVGKERIRAMFETTDGFEIAKRDLRIRGPGEILGQKQSGIAMLKFAHIEIDYKTLSIAREEAKKFIKNYPDLIKAHIERWTFGRDELLRT